MALDASQVDRDLWFEDGTVVLQVENTLFKVYRGTLRQQSPFFDDLFTLPQQENEESEKYEGCPLVVMPGDCASDVKVFLKAVFDFQCVICRLSLIKRTC
jgi:hypothetical protein